MQMARLQANDIGPLDRHASGLGERLEVQGFKFGVEIYGLGLVVLSIGFETNNMA